MAPFSVAELKGRASDRISAAKDKYSSTSSSSSGYNPPRPGSKPPPPPPPPPAPRGRVLTPSNHARIDAIPSLHGDKDDVDKIDWTKLTEEDKQAFFGWLDEFFSRYLNKPISSFAPSPPAFASTSNKVRLQSSGKVSALSPSSPIRPSLPPQRTGDSSVSSSSPPLPARRASSHLGSVEPSLSPPPPPMPPRRISSQSPATSPLIPPSRTPSSLSSPALSSPKAPPSMPPRQNSTRSPAPPRRNMPPPPPTGGPPKVNYMTRPSASPTPTPTSSGDPTVDLGMSFPPRPLRASNAADLAYYISAQNPWSAADDWYNSQSPLPPMQQGVLRNQIRGGSAASTFRGMCTLYGFVCLPDLSICYYRIVHPETPHRPTDSSVQRQAWYTNRPAAMSTDVLVRASVTYGEDIAGFAESYEGTGQYVTDGECWSMAHEAIQYTTQRHPDEIPVPSLSRTHGHLIYCGRPGQGYWRGGDTHIRRGDIVEWRTARVEEGSSWSTLGDPEHTSVIVADCVPNMQVSNGAPIPPAGLGELVVVEQSVGSPPRRMSYPLSGLVAGEIWIYRPVGLREYVGAEFEVQPPPGCPVMEA